MKNNHKFINQDFVLGTVVLALVALLLGTVMFIYPTFGGDVRPLVVEFDHVAGISPVKKGSPVLLSGALQDEGITGYPGRRRDSGPERRARAMTRVAPACRQDGHFCQRQLPAVPSASRSRRLRRRGPLRVAAPQGHVGCCRPVEW